MGKNNRARRAAKAHRRASRRSPSDHRTNPGPSGNRADGGALRSPDPGQLAASLLVHAAQARLDNDERTVRAAVQALTELPQPAVDGEVEAALRRVVPRLWDRGWQPVELVRQARRLAGPPAGRLAVAAVAADHRDRAPDTLDPRWAAQISELGAGRSADRWFSAWASDEELERGAALTAAVAVLGALYRCDDLAELIPPPGRAGVSARFGRSAPVDHPVLTKVRALLAQAESTTYPAEAETFTAKAQELMTRYAIDRAMLHGEWGSGPITRRIPIDDPYASAKSLLLHVVAKHSRCRAVFDDYHALSSVIGFEADVEATDVLFTSLLVQSQVALAAEAKGAPPGSQARSRLFRSSFLRGYAYRIGQRLAEINDQVARMVEAEQGRSVLPVLASRLEEVDAAVDAQFGRLVTSPFRAGWDGVGGMRGAAAADRAKLSFADLPGTKPPPQPRSTPSALREAG